MSPYLPAFSIFLVTRSLSTKKNPTRICRKMLSSLCPKVVVFSYDCRSEDRELSYEGKKYRKLSGRDFILHKIEHLDQNLFLVKIGSYPMRERNIENYQGGILFYTK